MHPHYFPFINAIRFCSYSSCVSALRLKISLRFSSRSRVAALSVCGSVLVTAEEAVDEATRGIGVALTEGEEAVLSTSVARDGEGEIVAWLPNVVAGVPELASEGAGLSAVTGESRRVAVEVGLLVGVRLTDVDAGGSTAAKAAFGLIGALPCLPSSTLIGCWDSPGRTSGITTSSLYFRMAPASTSICNAAGPRKRAVKTAAPETSDLLT